ncbi:Chromate resistance protein ChrB [Paenibacillus sp. J2TS4]|uniref:Chromate resistance protein ChrB n=1 Tax=Paenibacillus sp. J2TS4 TaxID=2807194 RepID=UPI001B1BD697|nr:hypothetical protein J2TS4_12830 [Paenibacillus sp. J2TS4]
MFRKIMRRDFFQCARETQAKSQLDLCEAKLAEFTDQVYQTKGQLDGRIVNEEN